VFYLKTAASSVCPIRTFNTSERIDFGPKYSGKNALNPNTSYNYSAESDSQAAATPSSPASPATSFLSSSPSSLDFNTASHVYLKPNFSWLHPNVVLDTQVRYGRAGVFARTNLPVGTTVIIWAGRIISREQLYELDDDEKDYTLQVDEEHFQAPIIPGLREPADFTNHSCTPNCGFSSPISLITMREVKTGEEITFDYAMCESVVSYTEFNCQCGTPLCRGNFTGDDWKLPELQERYRGFFSPYLEKKLALPCPKDVA